GEGHCPMDARLNLPARKDSYVLQEWALRMGMAQSFDEMQGGLSELLGLEVPKRQLEMYARDAGAAGRTFYDEHQAPRPKEKGPILVVEADGKGVPMKKPVPAEGPKRLKKGQKRDKKKMAWVASVHTTERRRGEEEDPKPLGKEVFAELQKRERFGQELFERAKPREKGAKRKVFLGDGQKDIWDLAEKFFPDYEEVLDWMHASEYLWKAAYLWLPESSPEAHAWVGRQQKRFRTGQVKDVIREIRKRAGDGTIRGKEKRKAAGKIADYFDKNRERMRYKRYRRMGLPIGTGAVEGTCRYLVKDRMERSGMRWTVEGAQAILTLRGAYVSEHWKALWGWYRAHEANRLYGKAAVVKAPTVGMAA
ncbi:MAG: ISKra4 family transposase, partial [Acidobacteria bacterium]|nr:ISKra4 family transposase [Acidobacteriota bacterium]